MSHTYPIYEVPCPHCDHIHDFSEDIAEGESWVVECKCGDEFRVIIRAEVVDG